MDVLLPKVAVFEPNKSPPRDSVFFWDPDVDDPNVGLLLFGILLVEGPKPVKLENFASLSA